MAISALCPPPPCPKYPAPGSLIIKPPALPQQPPLQSAGKAILPDSGTDADLAEFSSTGQQTHPASIDAYASSPKGPQRSDRLRSPKFYRRSIDVLPAAPGASPPTHLSPLHWAQQLPRARLAAEMRTSYIPPSHLRSPVELKQCEAPRAGLAGESPLALAGPTGEDCGSNRTPPEQPTEPNSRRSRWFGSHSHALSMQDLVRHPQPSEGSSLKPASPKTHLGVGSGVVGVKHSERPSPRAKHSLFSILNKSEPSLAIPAPPSPVPNTPTYHSFRSPKTPLSPMSAPSQPLLEHFRKPEKIHPVSTFNLLIDQGDTSRSPNSAHQPKIKSLLNQTSKRISQFTSRLNGPSSSMAHSGAASHPSSLTSQSTMAGTVPLSGTHFCSPPGADMHLLSPQSSAGFLPADAAVASKTPPGDLPKNTSNSKRGTSRIHSPSFYQSLKSRWRPDPSPGSRVRSPIATPPPTSDENSKTYGNYEKLKREQKNLLRSSPDRQANPALPQRSSSISVAHLLSCRSAAGISDMPLEETHDLGDDNSKTPSNKDKFSPLSALARSASRARTLSSSSTRSNSTPLPFRSALKQSNSVLKSFRRTQVPAGADKLSLGSASSVYSVNPDVSPLAVAEEDPPIPAVIDTAGVDSRPSGSDQGIFPRPEQSISNPDDPQARSTQESEDKRISHGSQHSNSRSSVTKSRLSTHSAKFQSDRYDNDLMAYLLPSPHLGQPDADQAMGLTRAPSLKDLVNQTPLPLDDTNSMEHPDQSTQPGSRRSSIAAKRRSSVIFPSDAQTAEELAKAQQLSIAEDLHHSNHVDSASRRSSISLVLKRKDSLNASTPELFQGIWEKELEENERKWKRLVRISDSQLASNQPTELESSQSHSNSTSIIDATEDHSAKSKNGASRWSSNENRRLSRSLASENGQADCQADVLGEVWDSFKSEAELSLSEINCEGATLGEFPSASDLHGLLATTSNVHLPDIEHIDSSGHSSVLRGLCRSVDHRARVVGLGLINSPDRSNLDRQLFSALDSEKSKSDDISVIPSPKLKKLSLLSHRALPNVNGGSKFKKRAPSSKESVESTLTDETASARSSLLDLSLVNAFPAPPKSHCSTLSSSSSHSVKSMKSTDSPRKGKLDLHVLPLTGNGPTSSRDSLRKTQSSFSVTRIGSKNSAEQGSKMLSFPPTSFSNRPRAQTGAGRCPVPAPLNLGSIPQYSSSKSTRPSLVASGGHKAAFINSPVLASPVPTLPLPDLPLPAQPSSPCRLDPDSLLSPNSCRGSNVTLSINGMTPRRPSLVIRPTLRSPRHGGAAMASPRAGEHHIMPLNLSPLSRLSSMAIHSPTTRPSPHPARLGALTLAAGPPHDPAGEFPSSLSSSIGTTSSTSTMPSPSTPSSSRMASSGRLPSVQAYSNAMLSPRLQSPSHHPDVKNSRYLVIHQTPKHSAEQRAAPDTIRPSRVSKPELNDPIVVTEQEDEQVSYGMAM